MNKQQTLFGDFTRGQQLQALRKIKLDSYKHRGRSVSGVICKSVLRAIDDRAGDRGCFASQATIAEEVGCGVATVSRAIAALVAQDLITIGKPNPWSPNTHRINFTEVHRRASLSDGRRQEQSLPKAKSAMADNQERHGRRREASLPQARQIDPLTDQPNAPTTALPDEWVRVRMRLADLGMKAASQATTAARERGLSFEYIEDLITAATKPSGAEPPAGVGWLCHWLTGKASPPVR